MKKILVFLLLITGLVKGQVVVPKSTTTFSNIVATGNATVNGTLKVNGTSTLSSTNINGTLSVGSSTAIGTSSLVQMYVTKGTSTVMVGEHSSGGSTIWMAATTPTTNNYWVRNSSGNILYNGTGHYFQSAAGTSFLGATSGSVYVNAPFRVGTNTAPSATLDVTGTMSVSSTATIAGLANLQGGLTSAGHLTTTGSGSLSIASNTNLIGNARLLSSSAATLTTGNTGTIAVLSDAVFAVQLNATTSPIADGATNYFGNIGSPLSSVATMGTIRLPYNCTLVAWQLNSTATATASTESTTLSIRANDATDTQLSTAITFSATQNVQESNGLSISFTAGDKINAKCLFPTFATNPTAYIGLTLFFVRRQ